MNIRDYVYKNIQLESKVNKMSQSGYKKNRFPNLQGEIFDCTICQNVVQNPK